MIRSAVTISLVEEARGGPFIFWDDLPRSLTAAKECGFDAVEIFAPSSDAIDVGALRKQLKETGLKVAAVGTGAGWVVRKLQLCDADAAQRERAVAFIRSMIDLGGAFDAPAIIGSMQGRWTESVPRNTALKYLADALHTLGEYALQHGVPLIYEPLNRYETNLINRLEDGAAFLTQRGISNVKLLADLFHMNIEETDLADALRHAGTHVGHVHFVDSNRRPAGYGHIDYRPIVSALCEMDYKGYASAEAFSWPDPTTAARKTMETFRRYFVV